MKKAAFPGAGEEIVLPRPKDLTNLPIFKLKYSAPFILAYDDHQLLFDIVQFEPHPKFYIYFDRGSRFD